MSNANKLKNSTTIDVIVDNKGRPTVTLKPNEIARYGNDPSTTYFLNGQKFDLSADKNYVIGIAAGQPAGPSPKLTCTEISKAGDGGFSDSQTTYNL